MAESKFKIGSVSDSDSSSQGDQLGREHNDKLQQMGKTLVSSLYMLVRSVKLYEPENAIFTKPLTLMVDTMNTIISREGRLELQGLKNSFYLNGMLIKVDSNSLDNIEELLTELRSKDVGAFTLTRPTNAEDIKNFIWIFAKEQEQNATEEGVAGRKLLNMKLTRWAKIKEKIDKDELENPDEQKVDRKKYAMTVYARAVVYIRKYVDTMRATGQVLNANKAARIVQDLVDIASEQRSHFLGMTTLKDDDDYLAYHQANVMLTSIVLGGELGLSKVSLRELGLVAMFHDMGMALVPEATLQKKGAVTKDEKGLIARAPLLAVRGILREKALTRTNLTRMVVTSEYKQEFGTAVKDSRGNISMVVPKGNIAVYSKIVSICATYDALTARRPYRDAYGPQIALMLMWSEMRNKFDPEMLKVFMNAMAIQPVKILRGRTATA